MILISSPSGAANQELAAYSPVFEARTNRLYFSPLNICTAPPMSKQFKSGQSAYSWKSSRVSRVYIYFQKHQVWTSLLNMCTSWVNILNFRIYALSKIENMHLHFMLPWDWTFLLILLVLPCARNKRNWAEIYQLIVSFSS
jgi:hypothetical protein